MQVTLDARMAFYTGIGRYIRSLCRTLSTQSPELSLSLLVDPCHTPPDAWYDACKTMPYAARIYSVGEQLHGHRLCRALAGQTSLFHFPHYNVPWWLPSNSVVTIHDLTHFQFPQYFNKYRVWLAWQLLQRAVQRAGHLIVVSEATRRVLEAQVPTAKGKTTVIYHGVEEHFTPLAAPMIRDFKCAEQLDTYLLYVGNGKPHKNLTRLLHAFARLRVSFSHVELVLLGVEASQLEGPMAGVRTYTAVPDAQLVRWYNAAQALILPSLSEGFGLPVVEAMACGTPVIASHLASLPEVVGEAGLLVDAQDVDALGQAMTRLLCEADLQHDLREKGIKRARLYSWREAARQTLDVYRAVASRCCVA